MLQPQGDIALMGGMPNTWAKIKRRLDELRIPQKELAAHLGVSEVRYSRWVGGTGLPEFWQLVRIADFTGLDLRYLLDDEVNEPRSNELTTAERIVLDDAREMGLELAAKVLRLAHRGVIGRPEQATRARSVGQQTERKAARAPKRSGPRKAKGA